MTKNEYQKSADFFYDLKEYGKKEALERNPSISIKGAIDNLYSCLAQMVQYNESDLKALQSSGFEISDAVIIASDKETIEHYNRCAKEVEDRLSKEQGLGLYSDDLKMFARYLIAFGDIEKSRKELSKTQKLSVLEKILNSSR